MNRNIISTLCNLALAEKANSKTLFFNAEYAIELAHFRHLSCIQFEYKKTKKLESHALKTFQDAPEGAFESALILGSQNAIETRFMIASALYKLQADGSIFCAAANDMGGSRLTKILNEYGCTNIQNLSKHKARFVSAIKPQRVDHETLNKDLQAGQMQPHPQTGFYTQAGLYGWDKIDKGSALLAENLPSDLKGAGADFGCGYGYLSHESLNKNNKIDKLYCIDSDYRALQCAKKNLENLSCDFEFMWTDLTQNQNLHALDFIIMNPPFHEGQKGDPVIGQKFIETASASLKKNGHLYMVANTHLPYEKTLEMNFSSFEKLTKQDGFKIFQAEK